MESLREAVVGFVPSDQVPSWVWAIERGDEDPLLALLLLRLSNVALLRLRCYLMPFQLLFETMMRILETPRGPHLSNLTTLEIDSAESEFSNCFQDWHAINVFAGLPSLRSIIAWNVWITDDEDYSEYLLPPRSSNVSSLTFEHSSIGPQRLCELLKGFKALKRFTYVNTYRAQHQFETFWICAALLAHAKASLEYLNLLQTIGSGKRYMGSLRDFENLKEIHTDLIFLVNTPRSGGRGLAQMLPAAVEKVHLHEDLYEKPETLQDMIITVAKGKRELLPNLIQLHFSLYLDEFDAQSGTMIAEMKEVCEKVGFELILD